MSRQITYYNTGFSANFISTWDTTKAGSASNTVVLPLLSGGVYSGTIDWGDGNTSPTSYANRTHVYASSGIYTITISGQVEGFQFNNSGDKLKLIDVSNWGMLTLTTGSVFYGCANINFSATDAPVITTTSFANMFYACTSFNSNIEHWDISTVQNMQSCFQECTNFNQPLDAWNMSNVTHMRWMFHWATSFNQPVNSWDVSNVTSLQATFFFADSFNQPLNNWDVSKVTIITFMLNNCNNFNSSVAWADTSSMATMLNPFHFSPLFNQDLSSWTVNQVTSFGDNFCANTNLSTANYDALLIAWAAQLPWSATYINFGSAKYTLGSPAATARAAIVGSGVTITDGGGI